MFRKLFITAGVFALLAAPAARAAAQGELRSDRATYFTFSQPVALPTVTLAPGKYLFKIADSQTTRSVVQIFNGDGTKIQATLFTVPAIRNDAPETPEVRFLEGAENAPAAIATWWYPGMKTGWEFIYPREQAMKLAQASNQAVLTTSKNVTNDEMKNADLVRVTPSGQSNPNGEPAASAVTGRSTRGQVSNTDQPNAQVPPARVTPPQTTTPPATTPTPATSQTTPRTTRPETPTTPTDPSRSDLPRTASATPLVALVGALALFGALIVRNWRRRMA
jgi:hypothetical protein